MVSASSPCSASSSRAAASTGPRVRPARCPGVRGRSTLRTIRRTVKLYDVQLRLRGVPMTRIALFHSVLGVRPGVLDAAERLRAAGHDGRGRRPVRRTGLRRLRRGLRLRRGHRLPGAHGSAPSRRSSTCPTVSSRRASRTAAAWPSSSRARARSSGVLHALGRAAARACSASRLAGGRAGADPLHGRRSVPAAGGDRRGGRGDAAAGGAARALRLPGRRAPVHGCEPAARVRRRERALLWERVLAFCER